MKTNLIIIVSIILFSTQTFGQYTQNLEKLKQENAKLKKELVIVKSANDTLTKNLIVLKQDTTFLRKELEICSLYTSNQSMNISCSNPNFKFTFIECKGLRDEQRVEITLMIEHKIVSQIIDLAPSGYYSETKLFDSQGNEYNPISFFIGGQEPKRSGNVPTNIPIKIVYTFNNILPGNDYMKLFSDNFSSTTYDYSNSQKGVLEIRNIKVKWD